MRALHREDGLSQPELGRLMGHDKSWVNRRLLLAEALSEELQADRGLVDATTGRELARLPRGNQRDVAAVVQRRGLRVEAASHDDGRSCRVIRSCVVEARVG